MTALSVDPLFRSVRRFASPRYVPAPPDQRHASTDAFADQRNSSRSSAGLDPPTPSPPSTRIPAPAPARNNHSPKLDCRLFAVQQFVATRITVRRKPSGSAMATRPPTGSPPSARNGRSAPKHPPSADGFATEDRSDRSPSNGEAPRGPRCCRRPAGSFREWRSGPG